MSFTAISIGYIKVHSAEVQRSRDLEVIGLAAHLFAIASQLLVNEGSARLMSRLQDFRPSETMPDLLERLVNIREDAGAVELYRILLTALVTIEAELCRVPAVAEVMPAWTDLEGLGSGEFRGLSGRVYHWVRPQSALAKARRLRFDEAVVHPPDPAPHPGFYLERLAFYWDSDPQLPSVSRVKPRPKTRNFFLKSGIDAAIRKRFRIALCPLAGEFHPQFGISDPEGRYFQALRPEGMVGSEKLHEHLTNLVGLASTEEIHILVLPELTVDQSAREHLQRLLAVGVRNGLPLRGVVAGSFHVWRSEGEPLPVNEALLLAHTGEVISAHSKKGRFRVSSGAVKPPFFPRAPVQVQSEVFEDIRFGSELKILETSLGRLALLICADAIAPDDRGYLPVIRKLRPDLLVVVAMTPETPLFETFAEEMSRYWIGTLFVNAHCMCQAAGSGTNLAAYDLALYEPEGMPPTRVRWRYGQEEPECIFFKPADRIKGWRPLSQVSAETGASKLEKDGRVYGLIIDLGVHWKTGVLASMGAGSEEEPEREP